MTARYNGTSSTPQGKAIEETLDRTRESPWLPADGVNGDGIVLERIWKLETSGRKHSAKTG